MQSVAFKSYIPELTLPFHIITLYLLFAMRSGEKKLKQVSDAMPLSAVSPIIFRD